MKKALLVSLALIMSLSLFAGGSSEEAATTESSSEEPLKIGAILISAPGDFGYSYMTDQGLKAAEEYYGDKIQITRLENIPENEESATAMQMLVDEGNELIIANSYNYMDYMKQVADENPDVYFEHCSGYVSGPNMHNYFGRMYQMRYLTGMIAGAMAENGKIGYVGAFNTPEVVRGIDAFTLGARSVNPNAEVTVVWTNTWFDPAIERQAAESLLDQGVDIIAQHQDTTEPAKAAIERGKYAIGYNADFGKIIGDDRVLVSAIWNWGNYFIPVIQSILDGTWEENNPAYWGGLEDDMITISDISPLVPEDVKTKVMDTYNQMKDGTFDVFWGEIKDNTGAVRQAEGEKMSDEDMLSLDWFVEGVNGSVY